MNFGNEGLEADTFKEEDHPSQQTARDLTSRAPSLSMTEKIVSSLYPGWADNMSESSSKRFLELKIYFFFKVFFPCSNHKCCD